MSTPYETALEQPSDVQEGAKTAAVEKPAPRPGTESASTQREPDEEKVLLAGYTLDQDGHPLPGSRVGLYEAEGQCGNRSYSFLGLRWSWFERAKGPLDEITPAGMIRLTGTESDENGYFEFRLHDLSGSYHFRCVGSERLFYYLGGPFSLADSPVRLRLQPVHELAGIVQDAESGIRVARATIDVIEEDPESRQDDWGHVGERSRVRRISDADGLFQFDVLLSGPYRVEVVHADYPGVFRQVVEIPVEADPFVVSLVQGKEGISISGRITDALTGLSVEGAFIEDTVGKHRTVSGPSGEYRLILTQKNVKSGRHLAVRASGYGIVPEYFAGPIESQEWNVALRPARLLTCRVVSDGERPVTGAKVFVRARLVTASGRSSSSYNYYQVTDDDGVCTFSDLPSVEKVEVFAFHAVLGRSIHEDIPVGDSDDPETVTLELTSGSATVIASVRDLNGSPVSGAQVRLLELKHDIPNAVVRQSIVLGALFSGFGTFRVARTDADGRAAFPDTLEGECLVQALAADYPVDGVDGREDPARSEIARFHTEPDGETSCELVLWRAFTLNGNVRTPDGDGLQGVHINLLGWSDERDWVLESPVAFSNEFGNYRFTRLNPLKRLAIAVRPD